MLYGKELSEGSFLKVFFSNFLFDDYNAFTRIFVQEDGSIHAFSI